MVLFWVIVIVIDFMINPEAYNGHERQTNHGTN